MTSFAPQSRDHEGHHLTWVYGEPHALWCHEPQMVCRSEVWKSGILSFASISESKTWPLKFPEVCGVTIANKGMCTACASGWHFFIAINYFFHYQVEDEWAEWNGGRAAFSKFLHTEYKEVYLNPTKFYIQVLLLFPFCVVINWFLPVPWHIKYPIHCAKAKQNKPDWEADPSLWGVEVMVKYSQARPVLPFCDGIAVGNPSNSIWGLRFSNFDYKKLNWAINDQSE